MKHLFSTLGAFCTCMVLSTLSVLGQCDIDFEFGDVAFGVSPDPALGETFDDALIGSSYFDVLHILLPATAEGVDPNYPPTLPVDSVVVVADAVEEGTLVGIVFTDTLTQEQFHADSLGLEVVLNNSGDSEDPYTFLGGLQYCAAFQGVPTRSGIYRIAIEIDAHATLSEIPFSVEYTFENFTLRINCPVIDNIDVVHVNSETGTDGLLSANLAEGVEAQSIIWLDQFGNEIASGDSAVVTEPGLYEVEITTEDCVSLFSDLVVVDEGLNCEISASVDVVNADEGMNNGSATLSVTNANGEWSANWYNELGLLIGVGPEVTGLASGEYSVLVLDDDGCSVEIEAISVATSTLEHVGAAWKLFPNPAKQFVMIQGLGEVSNWSMRGADGRLVREGRIGHDGQISLMGLSPGMYFVTVENQRGQSTKRLLVE